MVKNKSAQNWFESERPDRARLPDSGAANGSENGLRMRKLCQKEELPNNIEILNLFKKINKNKIKNKNFNKWVFLLTKKWWARWPPPGINIYMVD
jgi:hypothetical protein